MCIGIPLQVIESGTGYAVCGTGEGGDVEPRRIDTLLVGEQPVGTWLLTFLDTAREVLSDEHAARIRDALRAVELAMRGEGGGYGLFDDLEGREPQLPAFLRDRVSDNAAGD